MEEECAICGTENDGEVNVLGGTTLAKKDFFLCAVCACKLLDMLGVEETRVIECLGCLIYNKGEIPGRG